MIHQNLLIQSGTRPQMLKIQGITKISMQIIILIARILGIVKIIMKTADPDHNGGTIEGMVRDHILEITIKGLG